MSRANDILIVQRYSRLPGWERTKERWDQMTAASKRLSTPIIDNPNHPHYGPVRRLWVMLKQLDLMDFLDQYVFGLDETWEEALISYLNTGITEAQAQRIVLFETVLAYRHKENIDGSA